MEVATEPLRPLRLARLSERELASSDSLSLSLSLLSSVAVRAASRADIVSYGTEDKI